MNSALMGAWRSTRWLLLVAAVGGVLAADNAWVGSLRVGIASAGNWFSDASDSRTALAVFNDSIDLGSDSRQSMGQLLNGILFSRPSGGWSLITTPPGGRNRQLDYAAADPSSRPAFLDPNDFNRSSDFSASSSGGKTSSAIVKDKDGFTPNTIITMGTGTWTADSDGDWGDASKWDGNNVPDGAGTTADFSTVNLTADRTVILDFPRTVGNLTIGDTDGSNTYTLQADPNATLNFAQTNSGFTGNLTQSAGSGGDTISAPIVVGNVFYLAVKNQSLTNPLTISGSMSSSSGGKLIQFEGPGDIHVSGNIGNGTAGNSLTVAALGGIVVFSGTNTYTGTTSVLNGGTLLITGDNSAATGSVSVVNSGTLGGSGTIGGQVSIGGGGAGGTITGGTVTDTGTLTIGTVTLNQNLTFNPGEGFARYLANLDDLVSDTLIIFGDLNIIGNSHLEFAGSVNGFTTYTLATYLDRTGTFIVDPNDIPSGYSLVYGPNELLLVPTAVPEPATWIGAALGLGVVFAWRKRKR